NKQSSGYKNFRCAAEKQKARSNAIQTAILQYNVAAAALDVPRGPLTWAVVTHPTFLADWEVLRL
ncbi:hypothetical protein B0H13DRAFT_1646563, partial [Mycena leptocephala]